MRKAILLVLLCCVLSALAMGCMPNVTGGPVAFEPRSYPYQPAAPLFSGAK